MWFDQDVIFFGKQIVDSVGGIDLNLIVSLLFSFLLLVIYLGVVKFIIIECDIFIFLICVIWLIFIGG